MSRLREAVRALLAALGGGRDVYMGSRRRVYNATFMPDDDPVQALHAALDAQDEAPADALQARIEELEAERDRLEAALREECEYQGYGKLSEWSEDNRQELESRSPNLAAYLKSQEDPT